MLSPQKISANEFCHHHHIELSFLHTLQEYGLVEISLQEEEGYLEPEQLDAIEKIIRLHYDLQINLEGIDAIQHLLQRMTEMQSEITSLKNKLRLYEGPQ